MELNLTETIYAAMAVRSMLEKDLCRSDRENYEKLFFKLRISHRGQKIRETFNINPKEK